MDETNHKTDWCHRQWKSTIWSSSLYIFTKYKVFINNGSLKTVCLVRGLLVLLLSSNANCMSACLCIIMPYYSYYSTATVPCENEEIASIVYTALSVDKEVKSRLVTKQVSLQGRTIQVTISAVDAGSLRSSSNAFLNSLEFVLEVQKECM